MKKRMRWTMIAVLGLFSPAVLALGLGGAVVESYLGQPLDVRVELISQNDDELQSVTANLASADDFELLGLSLAAITVPLEFEVVTDAPKPYVHITSRLNVNEPVVQVLMEVVWASGRMLREYTLFLDPPTIASQAPPVAVTPAPVKTPPVEQETVPVVSIQKNVVAREETAQEPAPGTAEAGVRESVSEGMQDEQGQITGEQDSGEGVYGPVARGETLWGIAREYSAGSGYSINQAMLALQRKNPEAFIKGNINMLKRGAILRLPAYSELAELTSQEALREVLQQEEEFHSGVRPVAPDFETPTVADSGDYQASANEPKPEPELQEDQGHLELVPPAEEAVQDTQSAGVGPEQDNTDVETLEEDLARTEEELLNAKQENTYLSERIKALEAEAAEREKPAAEVEDSSLANMESKLAEERESGQPAPPVAITPGGEKQAWYAGKTPLLIGIAVVLIALVTWVLRRRSAGASYSYDEAVAQAEAEEAKHAIVKPERGDSEGETVVQPIPEAGPAMEPEPVIEPEEPVFEMEPVLEPEEPVFEMEPVVEMESFTGPEPEPGEFPTFGGVETGEEPTVVFEADALDAEPEAQPEWEYEETEEAAEEGESDPEIKLDLARAYLSLGDKEASKSMLDEVLKTGNEVQQAEARQMLEEL